jgi:peptidoglycan/xylan/chitin deacetylase (PgdA/CDA1 family)
MYSSVITSKPLIALTFDDGPTVEGTARLLDILKEHEVKATLFVIGNRVAKLPDLVKRAADEGHEIGNHTWTHPRMSELSREEALSQLQQTSDAIAAATGRMPALYRPPYIDTTEELDRWIENDLGMKVIAASVDSVDWQDHGAARTQENVLTKIAPGAIILCHETQPTTLDALPGMLRELQTRGFEFVTVSQLLAPSA